MRYVNWDVLIFPEGSTVPMQEFKTQCHVVGDPDPTHLRSPALNYMVPASLPSVTCFIPSLPAGFAFRVSIHSWEPPCHSPEAILTGRDSLIFEARVFIDGIYASAVLFNDKGPWPQVLDWAAGLDKDGNNKPLPFPLFHSEILTQDWWSPEQDLGRIKVVISEGFARGIHDLPFERIKNVVVFSFQHAPQDVLESSGVAWPNPEMWQTIYLPHYSSRSGQVIDYEAHVRSSLHLNRIGNGFRNMISPQTTFAATSSHNLVSLVNVSNHPVPVSQLGTVPWMTSDHVQDHSGSFARWHMGQLNSIPHFPRSASTSASSRSTTGSFVSQNGSSTGTPRILDLEQLLEENRSRNENNASSGIVVPINNNSNNNNRRGFNVSTSMMHPPPSAAAEARAASYTGHVNRRISSTRQASSIYSNNNNERVSTSDTTMSSMKSRRLSSSDEHKENTDPIIRPAPAKVIRSKKEGKAAGENVVSIVETTAQSSSVGPAVAAEDMIRVATKQNELPTNMVRPNSANANANAATTAMSSSSTSTMMMAAAPKRKRSQPALVAGGTKKPTTALVLVRSDPLVVVHHDHDLDSTSSPPTRKFSKASTSTSASTSAFPQSNSSSGTIPTNTTTTTKTMNNDDDVGDTEEEVDLPFSSSTKDDTTNTTITRPPLGKIENVLLRQGQGV